MQELLLIFCIVLVVGAVITALAVKAAALLFLIERYLTYASAAIIIGVMCFVGAEVFMRYVLNSPIPGHLEGSELLVCIIVFFAVAYTQSLKGHVGMTLIIESLPEKTKKILEIITLLLSVATCAILSYFSFKYAYNCWIIGDTCSLRCVCIFRRCIYLCLITILRTKLSLNRRFSQKKLPIR